MKTIPIAVFDDHTLMSKALENMIVENPNYRVVMNQPNGEDFIEALQKSRELPAFLMDNMPFKMESKPRNSSLKNHRKLKSLHLPWKMMKKFWSNAESRSQRIFAERYAAFRLLG